MNKYKYDLINPLSQEVIDTCVTETLTEAIKIFAGPRPSTWTVEFYCICYSPYKGGFGKVTDTSRGHTYGIIWYEQD